MTYAADVLYDEVAYVAFHLHWALDDILDLEHESRVRFVRAAERLSTTAG